MRQTIPQPSAQLFPFSLGHIAQWENTAFAFMLTLFCAFVLLLGAGRSYVGYNETDFINFTIPEAQRALNGEPLLSLYHPPLYALIIAGMKLVFGSWLAAGLAVSLLSGVVSMLTSYALFRKLAGPAAAWGAAIALLGSVSFMGESVRAANDTLFLALFLIATWLAVNALTERFAASWFFCGLVIGLALLTRSNALPLLLLVFAPVLTTDRGAGAALRPIALVIGGIVLPFLTMGGYALVSGSNILPINNHLNLAMTYFATGDRTTIDAALTVASRFEGLSDLLFTDPLRIVKIYLFDLYKLICFDLFYLVERPLFFLFLPGVFLLLGCHPSRPMILVVLLIVAEVLLVNFKPFEVRYYLFLVPVIGAAIGQISWWMVNLSLPQTTRYIFTATIALMVLSAMTTAALQIYRSSASQETEIVEVLPKIKDLRGADVAIVARKPHLAYHARVEGLYFPDFASLDQLKDYLDEPAFDIPKGFESFVDVTTEADDLYLFYGRKESTLRPQFSALADPATAPSWLEPVAVSREPGAWTLYRYLR